MIKIILYFKLCKKKKYRKYNIQCIILFRVGIPISFKVLQSIKRLLLCVVK